MPNLNHRLNWRFLFYKKSLIFAFFTPLFLPIFIGGLYLAIVAPGNAYAARSLIATTSSTPGSYCYANSGLGEYVVGRCNCNHADCSITENLSACPSSIGDNETSPSTGDCLLGTANGYLYICYSGSEQVCSACGQELDKTNYSPWRVSYGLVASRYSVTFKNDSSNYYQCEEATTPTVYYGCIAGYYQSGGSGINMTCTKCPSPSDSSTATNAIGETNITTCCIPNNSSFSVTAGSGKYKSQCCYSN